ncbi:metalloenzyme superfamily [Paenibacillus swuensis]|uniref:Metalloenzyme superfamily n=1 Tax=Paenibacillus swuensis TaxID=1178515 RepID=A0A172TPL5_9BACL|nr:metalloenzyme superfamily [Paenibacillus swuensis]
MTANEVLSLYKSAPSSPKKVLVIGIDGLRPDALQAANTPNIDALVSNGSYSWNAQANSNYTWSATGWSTVHTGVWYGKHGVKDNSWANSNFSQYPPLMNRVEDYNSTLYTASIVHWAPINATLLSGIDKEVNVSTDTAVTTETQKLMQTANPDLTFVHYDDVDHAGHDYGFSPAVPQYISAIEAIDAKVGTLVNAVTSREQYAQEDWLIILTTDHGGKGTSHGGSSVEERTIFLIVSGTSAAKGALAAAPNQTDTLITALKHLNVPIRTEWNLDGKAVGLLP